MADDRHKEIEEYLKSEKALYEAQKNEPKLLILGSSDSGKSTLVKQMKILHGNSFSKEEVDNYTREMYRNIFTICLVILKNLPAMQEKYGVLREACEKSQVAKHDAASRPDMLMIKQAQDLCAEKESVDLLSRPFGLNFPDNTDYIISNIYKYADSGYILSTDDILNVRIVTQQVSDHKFAIHGDDQVKGFTLYDVSGLEHHRKSWLPYFENVSSILFIVSLSSYDQVMVENKHVNRMADAIKLFDTTVNNKLLQRPSIIVFLNKHDLFKKKFLVVPIGNHFPGFATNGTDARDAVKFFKKKFVDSMADVRGKPRDSKFHVTSCTDTKLMMKVLVEVTSSVLKGILEKVGAL